MHPAEVAGWLAYDREFPSVERMLAILWETVYTALGGKDLPHLEGRWLGRTKEAVDQERRDHVFNIMRGKIDGIRD